MAMTRIEMLQTPALTAMPAPTLDEAQLLALAAELESARREARGVAPLTERYPAMNLSDAYAIAGAGVQLRERAGARRVGAKIGLTSRAVQRQLGVDAPDFGVLTADMAVADGGRFVRSGAIAARAEAEIAFILGADLPRTGITAATLLRAIAFALPAIEIVDSRVADWKIKLFDTIADNASSCAFVLGSRPVAVADFDPLRCGMTLRRNGEVASTGVGAACLGSPIAAACWLAETMGRLGEPLRAGDIVLSGALGPVVPVELGDHLEAEISGLGAVSFTVV